MALILVSPSIELGLRKISGRWSRLRVRSHIRVHLLKKNVNAEGLWSHIGVWSLIKGSFLAGTTVLEDIT